MSLIPNFPDQFTDEHHAWHQAGVHAQFPTRAISMGQPGSGIEFLTFHRNFTAKVLAWYYQQPFADPIAVMGWASVPNDLQQAQFGWNAQHAAEEQRIVTLNPAFASEDAFGIYVETGIHNNFLHSATAARFNEPTVGSLHSPQSTFFYQIHGLVQNWWAHWLDQFDAHYAAIFEQRGGPAWQARHGLTSAQYQQTFNDLLAQQYRLIHVSGYVLNEQERYAAIWEQSGGPAWQDRHGLTSDQYQQAFNDLTAQGYRLVRVSGCAVHGEPRFAGIWEQRGGPAWQARHGLTSAQYQQAFNELLAQGYRLIDVSGYGVNGQDQYAAIWEQSGGPAWQARHGLTSAQYQQTFNDLMAQGYRLVRVSGYAVQGEPRFAGIWEQGGGPAWQARHGLGASQYQQTFNDLVAEGYRLIDVSAY